MNYSEIKFINRSNNNIEIEKVPYEKFLKFLYHNPFGKLPLNLIIKRTFLSKFYGKKMNTSSSTKLIEPFIKSYNIDTKEFQSNIKDFLSFNDFFIRKLKSTARKIDFKENVLISPVDGRILVFDNLENSTNFFVKGVQFNLKKLLKNDEVVTKFQGGSILIARLAPIDYHRFHFPTNGLISYSRLINGYLYSVSPYAFKNNLKVYCENKREISILQTDKFGDIVLCEIGATMVGGIKQTYSPNTFVKKGDEKGYFFFGGSTCILLFEKNKVIFDEDLLNNSLKGLETKVFMGEKIGIFK